MRETFVNKKILAGHPFFLKSLPLLLRNAKNQLVSIDVICVLFAPKLDASTFMDGCRIDEACRASSRCEETCLMLYPIDLHQISYRVYDVAFSCTPGTSEEYTDRAYGSRPAVFLTGGLQIMMCNDRVCTPMHRIWHHRLTNLANQLFSGISLCFQI